MTKQTDYTTKAKDSRQYIDLIREKIDGIIYTSEKHFKEVFDGLNLLLAQLKNITIKIRDLPLTGDAITDLQIFSSEFNEPTLFTDIPDTLMDLAETCDPSFGYVHAIDLPNFTNSLESIINATKNEFSTRKQKLVRLSNQRAKELEREQQASKRSKIIEAPTKSHEEIELREKYEIPATIQSAEYNIIIACHNSITALTRSIIPRGNIRWKNLDNNRFVSKAEKDQILNIYQQLSYPRLLPGTLLSEIVNTLKNTIIVLNTLLLTKDELSADYPDEIGVELLSQAYMLSQDLFSVTWDKQALKEYILTLYQLKILKAQPTSRSDINANASRVSSIDKFTNQSKVQFLILECGLEYHDTFSYMDNSYFLELSQDRASIETFDKLLKSVGNPAMVVRINTDILKAIIGMYYKIKLSCKEANISMLDFISLPTNTLRILTRTGMLERMIIIIKHYQISPKEFLSASAQAHAKWLKLPILAVNTFNKSEHSHTIDNLDGMIANIYNLICAAIDKYTSTWSMQHLDDLSLIPEKCKASLKELGLTFMQTQIIYSNLDRMLSIFRKNSLKRYLAISSEYHSEISRIPLAGLEIFNTEEQPYRSMQVATFLLRCDEKLNSGLKAYRDTDTYIKEYMPEIHSLVQQLLGTNDPEDELSIFKRITLRLQIINTDNTLGMAHRYQALIHFLINSGLGLKLSAGKEFPHVKDRVENWHMHLEQDITTDFLFHHKNEEEIECNSVSVMNEFIRQIQLLSCTVVYNPANTHSEPFANTKILKSDSASSTLLMFLEKINKSRESINQLHRKNMRTAAQNANRIRVEKALAEEESVVTGMKNTLRNQYSQDPSPLYSSFGCSIFSTASMLEVPQTNAAKIAFQSITKEDVIEFLRNNKFSIKKLNILQFSDTPLISIINNKNATGETPLTLAISLELPNMVLALLTHGAIPDKTNSKGLTPLQLAAEHKLHSVQAEIYQRLTANTYKIPIGGRNIIRV